MTLGTLVKVVATTAFAIWFFRDGQGILSALLERPTQAEEPAGLLEQPLQTAAPNFSCAGKTRCTEMSSCEEATFYINNCPGTEMDGDRDGIPCESQWCGH